MPVMEVRKGSECTTRCLGPVSVTKSKLTGVAKMKCDEHHVCVYESEVNSVYQVEGTAPLKRQWAAGSVGFVPSFAEISSSPDRVHRAFGIRFHGGLFEKATVGVFDISRVGFEFVDISDPIVLQQAKSIAAMSSAADVELWPGMVEAASLSLAVSVIRKLSEKADAAFQVKESPLGLVRHRRVRDFVEANLQRRITLMELADVAGLSQYHFSRQFTSTVGMSPLRYVMSRRVEMAKREMAQPQATLADVAYACGFGGQSHFTTAFKAFTQLTPKEYRRNHGMCASGRPAA